MICEITQKDFEAKYPEVSTYGLRDYSPKFLEDGTILLDTEWNGEKYIIKENDMGISYHPITEWDKEAEQGTVVGYDTL